MSSTIESPLMDVNETAKFLHLSRATIYRRIDDGLLPKPRRIGKRVLFHREELKLWMQADCPPRESEIWKEIKKTGKAFLNVCLIILIGSLFPRRR